MRRNPELGNEAKRGQIWGRVTAYLDPAVLVALDDLAPVDESLPLRRRRDIVGRARRRPLPVLHLDRRQGRRRRDSERHQRARAVRGGERGIKRRAAASSCASGESREQLSGACRAVDGDIKAKRRRGRDVVMGGRSEAKGVEFSKCRSRKSRLPVMAPKGLSATLASFASSSYRACSPVRGYFGCGTSMQNSGGVSQP